VAVEDERRAEGGCLHFRSGCGRESEEGMGS
jgi:hypothetical protein